MEEDANYRNRVVVTIVGGSISGRGVCSAINCASKSGPTLRSSISIDVGCVLKVAVITVSSFLNSMCGFLYKTFLSQSTGSWRYTRFLDKCWPTTSSKATVPYMIAFKFHTRDVLPARFLWEEDCNGSSGLEKQYSCIVTSSTLSSSLRTFEYMADCISNSAAPSLWEQRVFGLRKVTGTLAEIWDLAVIEGCRSRTWMFDNYRK